MKYWLFYGFIVFFIVTAAFCGGFFYIVHNAMIDVSVLERYEPGKPSILLDKHGNEWARFARDRRKPVLLQEMPSHLLQAFIAAEDHAFFKHAGISCKGIIRSLLINLYYGKNKQGASTITQQLVRLLFFDAKKTIVRKIKEQCYALLIEQQFSKEQILQTYLNHVYFGCGIYGVEAASQRFWSKSVGELTVDESATLAAVINSPGRYCPLLYPLSSQKRRNIVLNSMYQLGFITLEECRENKQKPLSVHQQQNTTIAPHVKETIRLMVEELVGKEQLYAGGLTIQTTLDVSIQQHAEQYFGEQLQHLRDTLLPDADGALISIDTQSGQIRALVGGFDFEESKFNRALQARRQIGSTLKPLMYATALEHGARFDETELDEPLQIARGESVWIPRNNTRNFLGQMTLANALSRSNNIVSIKTLLRVGPDKVVDLIKNVYLGDAQPYPSLALGCIDCTLKQVVGMFNIFATHGEYVEPHLVLWIKDVWGKKIWKYKPIKKRIVSAPVSDQVNKVLTNAMQRAKVRQKNDWIDAESIGKTGTTNDSRTCWFAGATPEITTAIYIGCDDNKPLGSNIYAATTAFPIWLELHKSFSPHTKHFMYDASLKEVIIDGKTGEHVVHATDNTLTILVPR